jgi:hypothetical protein
MKPPTGGQEFLPSHGGDMSDMGSEEPLKVLSSQDVWGLKDPFDQMNLTYPGK